jgi:formate hydrogenlyase subunit 6/NADH:ubiquinone oxidoreductase subunit I
VQAIVLGPEYELADDSREKFIYTKEMLLEPDPREVAKEVDGAGSKA